MYKIREVHKLSASLFNLLVLSSKRHSKQKKTWSEQKKSVVRICFALPSPLQRAKQWAGKV